jgi:hypothetical protein
MVDASGEVNLTASYTPWGDLLSIEGEGEPQGSLVVPQSFIVLLHKRGKGRKCSRVDYLLLCLLVARRR